ncbi:MAG: hypothetical protein HKP51_00395 [Sulfitobacter sp.]|nr:hypothetical protein [Sulfitobacter sp.]
MADCLSLWWVWICIALGLGVIELLAPGFIFLGFAIGAVIMAGIVAVVSRTETTVISLNDIAIFDTTNIAALLAVFAIVSLGAWIVLKAAFRKQSSGARIVTHDINDN